METENKYHRIIDYPNGYGASIISNDMILDASGGLFEVAVLVDGRISYDTPITSDVIGGLDFNGVAKVLSQIRALPARS